MENNLSLKNVIQKLDFFNNLNEEQKNRLSEISTIRNYEKDYILSYEKTKINKLFFLIDGLAKAYKIDKYENEIFLFHIYQNNMISEILDTNNDELEFFSNISFIKDSRVLIVDYKCFKHEFLEQNILNSEFTNQIVLQSTKLQSLINREFIYDAVSKVAKMISTDLEIFNELKRSDISLMLHIRPSTLSRVLNNLKRREVIDIEHGKVFITDQYNLDLIYKEI